MALVLYIFYLLNVISVYSVGRLKRRELKGKCLSVKMQVWMTHEWKT